MPRRSVGGSLPVMSLPSMAIVPLVGSTIRLIIRSVVVLPHPDGPTRTVICPVGISRSRSSTATVPSAYRLVTPSKVINLFSPSDRQRFKIAVGHLRLLGGDCEPFPHCHRIELH